MQALSAWSVTTRRAPSRRCRDTRVYGHTTTAVHDMSTPHPLSSLPCTLPIVNIEPPFNFKPPGQLLARAHQLGGKRWRGGFRPLRFSADGIHQPLQESKCPIHLIHAASHQSYADLCIHCIPTGPGALHDRWVTAVAVVARCFSTVVCEICLP